MIISQKIRYQDLLKVNDQPTYQELLNTVEWGDFRLIIIARDNRCVKCNIIIEGDEGNYYRKLTPEETKKNDVEWENCSGIDLLGDGKHIVKGQKPIITGVRVIIQVHHKYYVQNKLPWTYPTKDLITVCRDCHVKIHSEEEILMYTDEQLTAYKKLESCPVCYGTGYREQYGYFQNGICFHCDGRGFKKTIFSL